MYLFENLNIFHDLKNDFTSWEIFLCTILACNTYFWGLYVLCRHYIAPAKADELRLNERLLFVVILTYSFILSFTIISLWQSLSHARASVATEASSLTMILQNTENLETIDKHNITLAVNNYVQSIIKDEWPAMSNGYSSDKTTAALADLLTVFHKTKLTTSQGKMSYNQIAIDINQVITSRLDRLTTLNSPLPKAVRRALVFGALACLTIICLMVCMIEGGVQIPTVFIIFSVTSLIAFNVALSTVLDYPFSGTGDTSISSSPYQLILYNQSQRPSLLNPRTNP